MNAAALAIRSGWITQGPRVAAFEEAFANFVGAQYACAASNCTTALHLALLAVGVHSGQRVITVSHSFISTANAIRYCGAEPIFVDIDPATFNISVLALEQALAKNCKKKGKPGGNVAAILVVHQMGMPCDLKAIVSLAKKYKIPVIEDAACAVGSEIYWEDKWQKIGKPHGDIACFSFHPRKVLTTGEGGMITTNNAAFDKRVRFLRHQGMSISDLKRHQSSKITFEEYPEVGYNYRLTDIQAAIGIEQLKKIPAIIKKRRELARMYQQKLSGISWLEVPKEPDYARSNWQSFCVRVLDSAPISRNNLMQKLLDLGISTRAGIMNSHQEKPYRNWKGKLAISENARKQGMILPLYTDMTEETIDFIVGGIKNV